MLSYYCTGNMLMLMYVQWRCWAGRFIPTVNAWLGRAGGYMSTSNLERIYIMGELLKIISVICFRKKDRAMLLTLVDRFRPWSCRLVSQQVAKMWSKITQGNHPMCVLVDQGHWVLVDWLPCSCQGSLVFELAVDMLAASFNYFGQCCSGDPHRWQMKW